MTSSGGGSRTQLLSKLSSLVEIYSREHQTKSALFWAGQAVTISGGDRDAVLAFAETLYRDGQFLRSAHAITVRQLEKSDAKCCYLAARATMEAGEPEDAMQILKDGEEAVELAARKVDENPKGDVNLRQVK